MIKQLIFLSLLSFSTTLSALQEDSFSDAFEATTSHFVSENLFVYLHAGPGTNYRIRGSVNAGTAITILQEDSEAGFTQITDGRNRTGWVKSEFVTDQLPVKLQLETLQSEISLQDDATAQVTQELSLLQARLEQSQNENASLKQENQTLQAQISNISQQLEQTDNEGKKELFFMGAIVAGSGLIFGIILTVLLKSRKRNDGFYDRY